MIYYLYCRFILLEIIMYSIYCCTVFLVFHLCVYTTIVMSFSNILVSIYYTSVYSLLLLCLCTTILLFWLCYGVVGNYSCLVPFTVAYPHSISIHLTYIHIYSVVILLPFSSFFDSYLVTDCLLIICSSFYLFNSISSNHSVFLS